MNTTDRRQDRTGAASSTTTRQATPHAAPLTLLNRLTARCAACGQILTIGDTGLPCPACAEYAVTADYIIDRIIGATPGICHTCGIDWGADGWYPTDTAPHTDIGTAGRLAAAAGRRCPPAASPHTAQSTSGGATGAAPTQKGEPTGPPTEHGGGPAIDHHTQTQKGNTMTTTHPPVLFIERITGAKEHRTTYIEVVEAADYDGPIPAATATADGIDIGDWPTGRASGPHTGADGSRVWHWHPHPASAGR